MGAAFAQIDGQDFPAPATTGVTAAFGAALLAFAVLLADVVKRDAAGDRFLLALAAGNAAFAAALAAWALAADGFTGAGRAVTWSTVAALLLLAAGEAWVVARSTQPTGDRVR
jgi:hypothetical protein